MDESIAPTPKAKKYSTIGLAALIVGIVVMLEGLYFIFSGEALSAIILMIVPGSIILFVLQFIPKKPVEIAALILLLIIASFPFTMRPEQEVDKAQQIRDLINSNEAEMENYLEQAKQNLGTTLTYSLSVGPSHHMYNPNPGDNTQLTFSCLEPDICSGGAEYIEITLWDLDVTESVDVSVSTCCSSSDGVNYQCKIGMGVSVTCTA